MVYGLVDYGSRFVVYASGFGHCPDLRKVDVRIPENGNSNSHGARTVHLIITMIEWF